jgi:hypothetical protein
MLVADDYPFGWLAEKYERFLAAFEDAWMGARRGPGTAQSQPGERAALLRVVRELHSAGG